MSLIIITKSKFFEEALKLILHGTEDNIDTAYSREDLIGKLKERDYDAIICDMSCAKRQIEGLHKEIKKLKPHIKIIVFSFDPPDKHRKFINSVGADGYINRPLHPESVIEGVSSIIKDKAF